ncbi:MAG: hypothetical protein WC476_12805 [Phycisphaerae bacterium]|jgi:hypothetical protein
MKIIRITDDIYRARIFIIPSFSNPSELVKYFRNSFDHKYKHEPGFDAMYYPFKSKSIRQHFLLFENFDNSARGISNFNHELGHLVYGIMEYVGIKYCDQSEEAFTYYTGYLTEKILEKFI